MNWNGLDFKRIGGEAGEVGAKPRLSVANIAKFPARSSDKRAFTVILNLPYIHIYIYKCVYALKKNLYTII
jgi:hypothetical protein